MALTSPQYEENHASLFAAFLIWRTDPLRAATHGFLHIAGSRAASANNNLHCLGAYLQEIISNCFLVSCLLWIKILIHSDPIITVDIIVGTRVASAIILICIFICIFLNAFFILEMALGNFILFTSFQDEPSEVSLLQFCNKSSVAILLYLFSIILFSSPGLWTFRSCYYVVCNSSYRESYHFPLIKQF